MTWRKVRWLWLLPIGLGLAGAALLLRVSVIETTLYFPEDLDVLLIVIGLTLAVFAALMLIMRETLDRLRHHELERARAQALEEHRRFIRRLDHELKNPITALRAGLASLELTLQDERQRHMLRLLDSQAQRMTRLISDLRKLAELESAPLDVQAIDIRTFLRQLEEFDFSDRRFTLRLPESGDLPPLIGDPELLLLALHNLLDNAVKYTRPGDAIEIAAEISDGDLVITVRDTGIGMPVEETAEVWEELYRGSNAQTLPGSGVGLALVRAIIDRHYGTVSLQSALESGTTVILRLPLA